MFIGSVVTTPGAAPMNTRLDPPLIHRSDSVRSNGRIIEVDHLIVTTGAWEARGESSDPAWVAIRFGEWVIAYRVRA